MLTPRFKLTQDDEHLFLWMHVPYIKYDDAECEISDNILYFSAPPYYLRLHLPGDVLIETGPSSYDLDSGDLTINIKKLNKGEKFEGLDMLTWLLTPKKSTHLNPNIEVIGKTENSADDDCVDRSSNCSHLSDNPNAVQAQDKSNSDENDIYDPNVCDGNEIDETEWFIDQTIKESESLTLGRDAKYGCGFALRRFNFSEFSSSVAFIIDVKDPNNLSVPERKQLREEQENSKFDCEHYLADLFDDDMIKELLKPSYLELMGNEGALCIFTDVEREKLLQLPKREYLIEPEMLSQLYFGLVDLIFAYAYNCRFARGEENIEADWTICKLSSTLSCFDSFCNLKEVVVACARRSLCFPLYRSWILFERIFQDLIFILKSGKSEILRCLLGIHSILQRSEDRYVLNELYITDYCVWIQTISPDEIDRLAKDLSKLEISKADINFNFNLLELETDAKKAMEVEESSDEDDVDVLAKRMKNTVNICPVHEDSDDDDGDGDDEDDSEDDEDDDDDDDDDDND